MQEIPGMCLFYYVNANDFYKISMNAFYKTIFWNCRERVLEILSIWMKMPI